MKVDQLKLKKEMTVSELIEQFDKSGVLGAGRVARASNLLVDMINDEDMDIFMSLGGPLVPGGIRNIVADLIRQTMNWGPYEWSLVSKVKGIIQNSITPKLKYIDESGAEQETPLNFQGGIKAIFNINLDEELDL